MDYQLSPIHNGVGAGSSLEPPPDNKPTTTHIVREESTETNTSQRDGDGEGDDDDDEEDSDEHPNRKRRKRRPTGVFKCDGEGCDKLFTRAEHLARHKLNHNPTVIYTCPWEGCTKSFVRSDLKERHVKRHEVRKLKDEAKALLIASGQAKKRRGKKKNEQPQPPKTTSGESDATTLQGLDTLAMAASRNKNHSQSSISPSTVTPASISQAALNPSSRSMVMINSLDSIILPTVQDSHPVNIHNYEDNTHVSAATDELNALKRGSIAKDVLMSNNLRTPHQFNDIASSNDSGSVHQMPKINPTETNAASPSFLINWLFDETQGGDTLGAMDPIPSFNHGNFFNPEDDPFGLSSNLLNDILSIPPNFPNPVQQTLITSEITKSLVDLIPEISDHEYIKHINHFLELYWSSFHIQYPILHKPSFSTFTCPPILLLAMIMTGASYATTEPHTKFERNPRELADLIAEPLRFIIFKSKDFAPPSKLYIIQSLLLLETYERLSTNRQLHERAYVYHGTTIQLLRRSPGLGGNPLNNKTEYTAKQNEPIWERWIEFEMLKRTALFAFFIDATHSIIFGYQIILSPQQIQLNLPCDDDLWESYLTAHEIPRKSDTLPFSVGLKKLLNREEVSTSRFGNKILLSGLLTIMFQMQQRDLQGSIIEFDQLRDTWKDTLSLAFDFWNCNVMKGCCNTNSHATSIHKTDLIDIIPLTLRSDDTRCKSPVYHMAQITLRIQHYDYYIYSGAPWRMNVKAEASDYELVENKIKEWSNSANGRISVIYAYMFMFEMFLSPQDAKQDFNYTNYDSNTEAIYNRLNVFALLTLLIWSYNFCLDGAESDILSGGADPNTVELVPKEDCFKYLRRIRDQFTKYAGEPVHLSKPQDAIKYNNLVRILANNVLPRIKNKHYMTGMLMTMSKIFSESYWEVGNEFSRLIWNTCLRSFGKQSVRCDDMYKTEF